MPNIVIGLFNFLPVYLKTTIFGIDNNSDQDTISNIHLIKNILIYRYDVNVILYRVYLIISQRIQEKTIFTGIFEFQKKMFTYNIFFVIDLLFNRYFKTRYKKINFFVRDFQVIRPIKLDITQNGFSNLFKLFNPILKKQNKFKIHSRFNGF